MVIIKNVFFVDVKERIRAFKHYKGNGSNYLGMIATCESGGAISIYGKHVHQYIPTSLLNSICEYLERTRNNNNIIIHQDYNFYTYIYSNSYLVEVETIEEVKLPN